MTNGPAHLSASSASSYENCPKKWKAEWLDKGPRVPSLAAERGTFVHLVMERLHRLPRLDRTLGAAHALARLAWREFTAGEAYRELTDTDAIGDEEWLEWRREAWANIVTAFALEDHARLDVVATEHRFTVDLGGVRFKGFIDRVHVEDDGPVVADYKTGKIPFKAEYEAEARRQLRLYAAAYEVDTGIVPVGARVIYLKGKGKVLHVEIDRWSIEDEIDWLREQWAGIQADVDRDEFAAKPNTLCAWCPVLATCEEGLAQVAERVASGRDVPASAAALVAAATTSD